MSSVGSHLRERRESRGVSLKEMARSTRVREQYLEALESDDFAVLPAVVFTKGFIRAYCQVLNEAPDGALRLYAEQIGAPASPGEGARPSGLADRNGRGREPILVSLVLLVILGVALFGLTFALQGRSRSALPASRRVVSVPPAPPIEPPAALGPAAAEPPAPHPATPAGGAPPRPLASPAPPLIPAMAVDVPYRLVVRVKETTWIRVRTEDGRATEETMAPGQVREWISNRPFVLTIGNAGGLALELNGRTLPPLGPSGAVVQDLVIPPARP